jgi:hypothetical protein
LPFVNCTTFGKCWLAILVVLIITGNFCKGGGGGKVGVDLSRFDSFWNGENGKSSNISIVELWLDDDEESGDGKLSKNFFNSCSNSTKKKKH